MQILVCGEGLVDLVPASPEPLAPLIPALGGGPFNVAIASARLGAETGFQSRLSTDGFGQQLVTQLEREGVDTSYLQRGSEPTTLAVTSINSDRSASYTFYVEGTADRLVEPHPVECDFACFGTCSLALEPGASRYAAVMAEMAGTGTVIALDPNIRPFYATSAHREFLRSLLPNVHVLKLSDEEVDFVSEEFLESVSVVIITKGGEGIEARLRGGETVSVPAFTVDVQDTIGAGDTIMGSVLAELARRAVTSTTLEQLGVDEWHEVLTFASAAAALTVSRKGANPPTRAEVESFMSQ